MTSDPPVVYRGHTLLGNSTFWGAVNAEHPDLAQIREMIAESYRTETGRASVTEKELGSWLFMALRGNPELRRGISTEKTPPRHIILPNLAVKFDYIIQRPCFLCMPYQKIDYIRFHLHTDPVSRQADRHSAFRSAVQDYLGRANHDFSDFYNERLCVAILFAMRASSQMADVDNMVKTVLDALQGYAYANDRQIDHLDAIRLNSGSDDEAFIGIRIAVTGIAENADVIWPEFDGKWVRTQGIEPIDLTPYL
ncbi:MAG: RusA family crossover junction endodeoxyribonuclease [Streptosporangiaceae bacterium]